MYHLGLAPLEGKTIAQVFQEKLESQETMETICFHCDQVYTRKIGMKIVEPSQVMVILLKRSIYNPVDGKKIMFNDQPIDLGGLIHLEADTGELLSYECIAAIQHKGSAESEEYQALLQHNQTFYVVDGFNTMYMANVDDSTSKNSVNYSHIFLYMKVPSY